MRFAKVLRQPVILEWCATPHRSARMYLVNKILRKLKWRWIPKPNATEATLIAALRDRIRSLPAIEIRAESNSAERAWLANRRELQRELLSKDPRTFLQFPVIRATMFVDDSTYITDELKALRSESSWQNRWRPAIQESDSIRAPRHPRFKSSSGNLIHYAFHLATFERVSGLDVSRLNSIVEFGGGYGGMCRLIHRLGFRGKYVIFDLPEFNALQEFYLTSNDIAVEPFSLGSTHTQCINDFSLLEELNRLSPPDLFVATWSLSETPLDLRRQILGAVRPRNWFISYQHEFASINNAQFFEDWSRQATDWQWRTIPLPHHPGENSYIIGTLVDELAP